MSKKFIISVLLLLTQVSLASGALRRAASRMPLNARLVSRAFASTAQPTMTSQRKEQGFWTEEKVLSYLEDKNLPTNGINIVLDGKFITQNSSSKILFVQGGPLELVQGYYKCTIKTEVPSSGGFIGGALGLYIGLGLVGPMNNVLTPIFGWAIGYGVGKGKRQMTEKELSRKTLCKAEGLVTKEEFEEYKNFLENVEKRAEV